MSSIQRKRIYEYYLSLGGYKNIYGVRMQWGFRLMLLIYCVKNAKTLTLFFINNIYFITLFVENQSVLSSKRKKRKIKCTIRFSTSKVNLWFRYCFCMTLIKLWALELMELWHSWEKIKLLWDDSNFIIHTVHCIIYREHLSLL